MSTKEESVQPVTTPSVADPREEACRYLDTLRGQNLVNEIIELFLSRSPLFSDHDYCNLIGHMPAAKLIRRPTG